MHFLDQVSEEEAECIFLAFCCKNASIDEEAMFCQHLETFLYGYNTTMINCNEIYKSAMPIDFVTSVYERARVIARANSALRPKLSEFYDFLSDTNYNRILIKSSLYLADHHHRLQCHKYMSIALKLGLSVWKKFKMVDKITPEFISIIMIQYLRYISLHKLSVCLFGECFKTFLRYFNCGNATISGGDPLNEVLPEVLTEAYKLRFNLFSIWTGKGVDRLTHMYPLRWISQNQQRFLILTDFGFEDRYYIDGVEDYKRSVEMVDSYDLFHVEYIIDPADIKSNYNYDRFIERQYRFYQVLLLYAMTVYCERNAPPELCEEILRVIWETTSESFLTLKEFCPYFDRSDIDTSQYGEAWKWYVKIVSEDKPPSDEPRSLKHLSRCSIRRKLVEAAHQSVFHSIASFHIPFMLKNYLRLDR